MTVSKIAFAVGLLMTLSCAKPAFPPGDGPGAITVPFDLLKSMHMVVQVKVNGKGPYRVIFDTGAPVMLLNNKVAKESGLLGKSDKPALFNPFGGSMVQMKIKSLQLGDLKAEDVSTVIMDHPTIELMSKFLGPVEGIVGFPFFARYKTTIDYQAKQLIFVPNGYNPPDALQALMSRFMGLNSTANVKHLAPAAQWGLVLEKSPGEEPGVAVKEVRPGSAANTAGIRAGDRILTLDGRWTDSVPDVYLAASHVKPDEEAKVTLRRGSEEVSLAVKPRRGL
jgi:Aspartyl protease/PDZ domain